MEPLSDLRSERNPPKRTIRNLQIMWPSDPRLPSADSNLTGFDCLCTLYRHIYSFVPREKWPARDADTAGPYPKILQFFWGDFQPDQAPKQTISRARIAAMRQFRRAMPPGALRRANDFESLCRSPAMIELLWKNEEFQFFQHFFHRKKGTEEWTQSEDIATPQERAMVAALQWDTADGHNMRSFLNKELVKCFSIDDQPGFMAKFNAPRVIQVTITFGKWRRPALDELWNFRVQVPNKAGEPGEVHSYGLVAIVRPRNASMGIYSDTIRTFDQKGVECLPSQAHLAPDRQTWGDKYWEPQPEGQKLVLFYLQMTSLPLPTRPLVPVRWRTGHLAESYYRARENSANQTAIDGIGMEDDDVFEDRSLRPRDPAMPRLPPNFVPTPRRIRELEDRLSGMAVTSEPTGPVGPPKRQADQDDAPSATANNTPDEGANKRRKLAHPATQFQLQSQSQPQRPQSQSQSQPHSQPHSQPQTQPQTQTQTVPSTEWDLQRPTTRGRNRGRGSRVYPSGRPGSPRHQQAEAPRDERRPPSQQHRGRSGGSHRGGPRGSFTGSFRGSSRGNSRGRSRGSSRGRSRRGQL